MGMQMNALSQQEYSRHNIRIKSLPIRVLKVILLTTLLLESLDNSELSRVMHVLHHKPVDRFFVFSVDSCCFDELAADLLDGLIVFGEEMADEGVHGECCCCSEAGVWSAVVYRLKVRSIVIRVDVVRVLCGYTMEQ